MAVDTETAILLTVFVAAVSFLLYDWRRKKSAAAKKARQSQAPEQRIGPYAWFRAESDRAGFELDVRPAGGDPWTAQIPWNSIRRVCFRATGAYASDELHVFVEGRQLGYVIPVEADGGSELMAELMERDLFPAELAMRSIAEDEGLVCWPEDGDSSGTR